MKRISVALTILFILLVISSCIEELNFPVETCTFNESIWNTTNPNAKLYQEILDEYVKKGLPGISVAIETPEFDWWVGCAGIARIEEGVTLQPCHVFPSASMAKTYRAVMILRLYEDDILDLDDPIRKYLPEDMWSQITNAEEVTIRQLLSHTSGIAKSGISETVDVFNDPEAERTTESIIEDYIFGKPALFPPGDDFQYSNIGYSLLGFILEKASGLTLGEFFEKEISIPLGLVNTFYIASPGYPDSIPHKVNGYYEAFSGKLINCTDMMAAVDRTYSAESDILASPYEYARFIQELMRGNILNSSTIELMKANENVLTEKIGYGLGIMRYHDIRDFDDSYGHTGGTIGARCIMMYFPDKETTISFTANLGGGETFSTTVFNHLVSEFVHLTFNGERVKFDE